jgi:hypothetical protein
MVHNFFKNGKNKITKFGTGTDFSNLKSGGTGTGTHFREIKK